jgi:hypothetical protein
MYTLPQTEVEMHRPPWWDYSGQRAYANFLFIENKQAALEDRPFFCPRGVASSTEASACAGYQMGLDERKSSNFDFSNTVTRRSTSC